MRPSGHIHSAVITTFIIFKLNPSVDILSGACFIIGVMLLDADFILALSNLGPDNHREFISHNIFLYIILVPFAFLVNNYLFWLIFGCLFHLLFDLFDWGLPLRPTTFVTPHILQVPENKQESYFFKTYFSNRLIQGFEIIMFSGFFIATLLLNNELVYLIAFIEFFVVLEFLYQLIQAKKLGLVHF